MPLSKIKTASITDNAITSNQMASFHGRRNSIINGGFQVWQYGSSHSSQGYGSADRWFLNLSGGTATASRQSFANGQTDVPGKPLYYMNLNVSTGNDNCGWQYRREGTWQFASEVYTLSFYAKSSNPRAMSVLSDSHDVSADATVNNTVSPATFTPTSSWQRFTFKITHSNMSGLASYANGDWTRIGINQGSDTSTAAWQLDLWGVQLEKGDIDPTPFEHISFAEELQLCKRYFQKTFNYETAPENGGSATGISYNGGMLGYSGTNNNGALTGFWQFSPEMRATPNLSKYGNNSGQWAYMTAPNSSTSWSGGSGYFTNVKASGVNFGQNISGDTHMFGFGHLTARAEL